MGPHVQVVDSDKNWFEQYPVDLQVTTCKSEALRKFATPYEDTISVNVHTSNYKAFFSENVI